MQLLTEYHFLSCFVRKPVIKCLVSWCGRAISMLCRHREHLSTGIHMEMKWGTDISMLHISLDVNFESPTSRLQNSLHFQALQVTFFYILCPWSRESIGRPLLTVWSFNFNLSLPLILMLHFKLTAKSSRFSKTYAIQMGKTHDQEER